MPTYATETRASRDELLDFVRPRHHLILATHRKDGTEQLSPVTAGVDEEGRVVISSYPHRAKARNLRRDPAAAALVQSDEWNGPWVQLTGTCEVIDLPDALEPL
ncbi:MAG: TIGR03618 family F420-dependent PPOX class oxidoreductase, partial [Pseudonocardia sp.]|nr:TIGR03618 family F420-dependent PPOX class oxidoreductase [Pseudonocardia sp.]